MQCCPQALGTSQYLYTVTDIWLLMLCVVLRLGNSAELLHSALLYTKLRDSTLRLCLVCSRLSLACYLFIDHAVWAAKVGLITADSSKLRRIAARLWLLSLTAGLLRDAIEISRALRMEITKRREVEQRRAVASQANDTQYSLTEQSIDIIARFAANRPLLVDCIKNLADIFLPLATLGYITSDGLHGLMGMVSSYMAILTIWDPALKLLP